MKQSFSQPTKIFGFLVCSLLMWSVFSVASSAQNYDPFRSYKSVSLERIRQNPEVYQNVHVKFRILLNRVGEIWSPFYSPFDFGNYVGFSGWEPDESIWTKRGIVNDFPFLFISNYHEDIEKVLEVPRFSLLEIKGTVSSSFSNKAWIEIRQVRILKKKMMTKKSLRSLVLGQKNDQAGNPVQAIRNYKNGLRNSSLTTSQKTKVLKRMALLSFRAEDYHDVYHYLDQIHDLNGKLDAEMNQLKSNTRARIRKKQWKEEKQHEDHTSDQSKTEAKESNGEKTNNQTQPETTQTENQEESRSEDE